MRTNAHRRLIVLTMAAALCGAVCAQGRKDFAFSSNEFGFPEVVDVTLTFTAESERTFRLQYSKPPAYPDLGMFYTMLYFCGARKIALEQGFDRFGLAVEKGGETGIGFFLKPGEVAAEVLEPRFANQPALPIADPAIAASCDAGAAHPTVPTHPPGTAPTGVTHLEHCTEWRYRDDRFGAVNNCKDPVTIQFMLTSDQRVIERDIKPGEFFDTGLSRDERLIAGGWLFSACPVGYAPSVPFSLAYQNDIRASRYGCSKK